MIEDRDLLIDGESFPFLIEENPTVEDVFDDDGTLIYQRLVIGIFVPTTEGWIDGPATLEDRRTPTSK